MRIANQELQNHILDRFIIDNNTIFDTHYNKSIKPYLHKTGYLYLNVRYNGKHTCIAFHQIVWILNHHTLPIAPFSIDHIDQNKLNNSIDNLRIANHRLQLINKKNHNQYYGVCLKHGRYSAQMQCNKIAKYFGSYKCEKIAHIRIISEILNSNMPHIEKQILLSKCDLSIHLSHI
jgi:hypothetical protein